MLDVFHQQVKGVLRVRLDQLELRERILVGLDVVAVLHLVKTICRVPMRLVSTLMISVGKSGNHGARISTGVKVDRQQRIHRASDCDQRLSDVAGCRDCGDIGADIRGRQAVDIAVGSGARSVGVIARVEPLLPLA